MRVNRPQTGSLGLYKPSLTRAGSIESTQVDFVCIAAIFNRLVFWQKWDAPERLYLISIS